tara:strand:- start:5 stop:442 length:438 start_codon:yes stop_codon:yes gene_type:complete
MKRIYIYGILDDDDNIIYVGESLKPKSRLSNHFAHSGWKRCKILEIFEDREHYWINKLISEGNTLNNTILLTSNKWDKRVWSVGDILVNHPRNIRQVKLRNKLTGEIYRDGEHASREIEGVSQYVANNLRLYPTSKYHEILEFVD